MRTRSNEKSPHSSEFSGCRSLIDQYRYIGSSLIKNEFRSSERPTRMLIPTRDSEEEFAAILATVPVEVLESYLDDLLDLNVTDDSLFIAQVESHWRGSMVGFFLALIAGVSLYVPVDSSSVFIPLCLGIFFVSGLLVALNVFPRSRVMRRFSFATLISRVISRRRGYDKNEPTSLAPRIIRDFFGGGRSRQWALETHSAGRVSSTPLSPRDRYYFH